MKEMYYGETIGCSVMCASDIDSFLNKLELMYPKMDVDHLEFLEEIFSMFFAQAHQQYLTDKAKSNIYMFLHFLKRQNLDEDEKKFFNTYQGKIMSILNGPDCDKQVVDFYRLQLAVRTNKPVEEISNNKVRRLQAQLDESITYESEVLFSHLDESDEDFSKRSIRFISSPYYIECVRSLIHDYPHLMEYPQFKNRVCDNLERRANLRVKYRGFSLQKINSYIGEMVLKRDAQKLYKQVVGN